MKQGIELGELELNIDILVGDGGGQCVQKSQVTRRFEWTLGTNPRFPQLHPCFNKIAQASEAILKSMFTQR